MACWRQLPRTTSCQRSDPCRGQDPRSGADGSRYVGDDGALHARSAGAQPPGHRNPRRTRRQGHSFAVRSNKQRPSFLPGFLVRRRCRLNLRPPASRAPANSGRPEPDFGELTRACRRPPSPPTGRTSPPSGHPSRGAGQFADTGCRAAPPCPRRKTAVPLSLSGTLDRSTEPRSGTLRPGHRS